MISAVLRLRHNPLKAAKRARSISSTDITDKVADNFLRLVNLVAQKYLATSGLIISWPNKSSDPHELIRAKVKYYRSHRSIDQHTIRSGHKSQV